MLFFFSSRRRHTRFKCDWSSDVCSSDPLEAGRELGVEAILDGRVQRDDKKIRVTARLLSVRDGSSLWVGKFDDFFTNLFALQDSISEKMAEALSLRLTSDEQQLLTRR